MSLLTKTKSQLLNTFYIADFYNVSDFFLTVVLEGQVKIFLYVDFYLSFLRHIFME